MSDLTPERRAEWRATAMKHPSGQPCNGIHDATPDRRIVVLLDALDEKDAENTTLRNEVDDYRRSISFGTECLSCARRLEVLYATENELDGLRAKVAAVEAVCDVGYEIGMSGARSQVLPLVEVADVRAALAKGDV